MDPLGHLEDGEEKKKVLYEWKRKTLLISYIFWFLLGGVGGHRFYLGKTESGFAMLGLTILSIILVSIEGLFILPLGIWLVIDLFMIPGFVRDHNARLARDLGLPADGNVESRSH